jgi:hypothetical protein
MPSRFTATAEGRANVLITPCFVAPVFDPKGPPEARRDYRQYRAIWDTGATNTVISHRVAEQCGLKQVGVARVRDTHEVRWCATYFVNLRLMNDMLFVGRKVTKANLTGADILIGMDIIGEGDFAVTSKDGNTVFSFRVPSVECIDFVKADTEGRR